MKKLDNQRVKKIIAILLIFLFSFNLRLWNLNQMGRTWDEPAYVEVGNKFIKLIAKGDILNRFFYEWVDEPPLARYVYGVFSILGEKGIEDGKVVFNYDYTFARIASVIVSSLAVITVVLLCWEFISFAVGIYSGVILSMLPIFLAFSQIATLESFLFFTFTASFYSHLRFLSKISYKRAILAGIFLGLAILAKITNILLIPLFLITYFIWKKYSIQQNKLITFKNFCVLTISSLITFFIIWPMPLFNLHRVISWNYELRTRLGSQPSIEVFFGKLIHVPIFYYFVFFLISTPIIILILFFIGSKYISDYGIKFKKLDSRFKKINSKWIFYSLIVWFCLPFVQSFYNFRHQGIRYIIEIYAPLSIIAALGLNYIISKFSKRPLAKLVVLLFLVVYLFITLFRVSPYYLDYFNEAVGGTNGVYSKGLFQLGWWGQGLREAGYYLQDNAKKNSSIALFISSPHVFPPIKNQKLIFIDPNKDIYDPKIKYDYVVVNYFHVLREGFDDSKIKHDYKLMYQVKVDGASLVDIYEKNN